ncbi:hypothetical protein SAMN05421853_11774 [Roseivivax halotolerans]|uniref:Uncharacterized protein n=1 Tax=Roseivivax halotolerans TaxID=93684 RepID=A0A1I6ADA4_9RHOB|nr:hypothetical protein [Roseivivax halotolerans]SFQ66600.1 hypothetical protein SAMN05421853_11774 [Roseivivax halotolerans]
MELTQEHARIESLISGIDGVKSITWEADKELTINTIYSEAQLTEDEHRKRIFEAVGHIFENNSVDLDRWGVADNEGNCSHVMRSSNIT